MPGHSQMAPFGTRWAKRVMPATLQMLMRHQSIKTTMKYYVDLDAHELGDELWNQFGPDSTTKPQSRRSRGTKT